MATGQQLKTTPKSVRILRNSFSLAFLSALTVLTSASKPNYKIVFENNSSLQRTDEIMVLSRSFLEKKLGKIEHGKTLQFTYNNKTTIFQLDDLNLDGKWDEAVFPLSLSPYQRIEAEINWVETSELKEVTQKAHVRLKKKMANGDYGLNLKEDVMPPNLQANDFNTMPIPLYQTEGPAWENDKVAFRSYFDVRNAKDIFGKTTSSMVMDTVGTMGDKYYHHQAEWGMDILKVGQSLGAGALAINVKKNGTDTLIRIAGPVVGKTIYQLIADGPYRSTLKINYEKVNIAGQLYSIAEEISIWGGQYFYQNKITLSKTYGNELVVTGIVNMRSTDSFKFEAAGINCMYSLDKQSENNDMLGMAIMAKKDGVAYFNQTPKTGNGIINTYTASLKPLNNICTYRFYAAWEQSNKKFANKNFMENFLKEECYKWSHPITVI